MSTEKLIDMVHKYPELYDKNHKDFWNLQKNKIWKQIGHAVGRYSGEQAKQRWRTVRASYARYLRARAKKGAARKQYVWSERMEIFRPFLTGPQTRPKTKRSAPELGRQLPETTVESEDDAHAEEVAQEPQTEPTRQPPTPTQSELITCDIEVNTEAPAMVPKQETDRLSFQEQTPPAEAVASNPVGKRMCPLGRADLQIPAACRIEDRVGNDEIDSLFLAYAMTVKKFSPRRQVLTKLKIAQLIAEEELTHLDETEPLAAQACSHSVIP